MLTPSSRRCLRRYDRHLYLSVALVVLGLLTDEGIGSDRVIRKDSAGAFRILLMANGRPRSRLSPTECNGLHAVRSVLSGLALLLLLYSAIFAKPL